MSQIATALERIAAAAKAQGLPRFAERAGVPYTTVFEWSKADWRPKAVQTLEKLSDAAEFTELPDAQEAPTDAVDAA